MKNQIYIRHAPLIIQIESLEQLMSHDSFDCTDIRANILAVTLACLLTSRKLTLGLGSDHLATLWNTG
jgi:hypothetical protein